MTDPHAESARAPGFERLNYFHGQILGHHDLRDEQRFFRDKLRLHNRCLHGHGVVCGLEVTPEPGESDPCLPDCPADPEELRRRGRALVEEAERLAETARTLDGEARDQLLRAAAALKEQAEQLEALADAGPGGDQVRAPRLRIGPGLAIDPDGRELLVSTPIVVDPWRCLPPAERTRIGDGPVTLWVSLCYDELPSRLVRPISRDRCAPRGDEPTRIREAVRVRVTLDPPPVDARCNPCCEPAPDCCVLLARVECVRPRRELAAEQIDASVRRMLAPYELATITHVSWVHGATYKHPLYEQLLGRAQPREGVGLRLCFSRPVRADTLRAPSVFEVLRYTGGSSPAGGVQWIGFAMDETSEELVTEATFRQVTDERWSPGDRVHIVLRADYVLDACCRRLDGNGVPGLPLTDDAVLPIAPGTTVAGDIPAPAMDPKERAQAARPQPERPDPERPHPGYPAPCAPCEGPTDRPGPFRSGNGTPGGTFESWFYVR